QNSTFMKNIFLLLLLVTGIASSVAQSDRHNVVVQNLILRLNSNDFEGIYQSFSPRMQKAHSKKYYFDFFSKLKKNHGNLLELELLQYPENDKKQSRAIYDGTFERDILTVRITIDSKNKIIGLYFKIKPTS